MEDYYPNGRTVSKALLSQPWMLLLILAKGKGEEEKEEVQESRVCLSLVPQDFSVDVF
jgi:hypothetical protein